MVTALQVIGYKKSGKTAVIESLIQELTKRQIKTSVIKHDAHTGTMDYPGTDTDRFADAGAAEVVLKSSRGLFYRDTNCSDLNLIDIINHLPNHPKVILVEGFKQAPFPKLILLKEANDRQLLNRYPAIIQVASIFSDNLLYPSEPFGLDAITQWFIHDFLSKELSNDRFTHPF